MEVSLQMQEVWRVALIVVTATSCAALPLNAGPRTTKKTARERK